MAHRAQVGLSILTHADEDDATSVRAARAEVDAAALRQAESNEG